MKYDTKVVHAGAAQHDPSTGSLITPVYHTSTYVQDSPGKHKGYMYARGQNPTRDALESAIATLENARFGLCFSSGIAAVDAIVRMLQPGDELITTTDLYGGSQRLFAGITIPAGIKVSYISFEDPSSLEQLISANTKLVWLETPTNPLLSIIDIKAIAAVTIAANIPLAVDNTFATPYLQRPLDLGADIVMHSATKYLGGHSDLIMGALAVNDEELFQKLKFIQNTCGAIPGAQDCFLTHRGIKTLHVRMERNCANARKVAIFLEQHSKVDRVYFPGLASHPGHQLARQQMKDFGAMLSFNLKEDTLEAAIPIMERVKVFSLAESLGGVESLCGHPATMSHGSMEREARLAVGIKDSMIRLSIGIEDVEDLIEDLEHALG